MTARPDIRLDRETWDGRLAVETISARGIEAFAPMSLYHAWCLGWYRTDEYPRGTTTRANADACLRAYIRNAGLIVESEDGGDNART